MATNATIKPGDFSSTQSLARKAGSLATQKVWLPKLLYDCLPYFYLTAGFAALFATLYIADWFWVVPHYLLFSGACLHLACLILRRRHIESATGTDDPSAADHRP